jgi:hypothetical protein
MADVPFELPFKDGTRVAHIFELLSDGEWHCGKHELPSTQPAKYIQTLRQHGFQVVNQTRYCPQCRDKTVHRLLISTSPTRASSLRLRIPRKLRQRIYACYAHVEAITMREMSPTQLEIDHRFPQVRWSEDETFDPYMPTAEIRRRFQLLTRANNLWKSRYCEHCKATGERGTFIGIAYFAEGGPHWNPAIPADDERGCFGCFWYNPHVWRQALNATLQAEHEEPATTPGEGGYEQLSFL